MKGTKKLLIQSKKCIFHFLIIKFGEQTMDLQIKEFR